MQTNPATDTDLRRLILDTTRHLLMQDGYKSLSMRKIAREIDYSATSIYLYFDNKDALFHALIDEGMEHLLGALKQAEASNPSDAPTRLQAICRQYVNFGLSNPEYYEIMFMLHPEHMERYPAEKYRRARRNLDVIAAVLSEGVDQGFFVMKDPRVTASTIWSALHGAVSLLLVQRVDIRIDRNDFIESTIAFVLQGVLGKDAITTISS
ncbi:MAG TPA: TetR/AcrR family transcriptional regulator [Rhodothermales bacterium]|nr:TetR/AcrR family transcriptional regulator [Rhodothermales bacterium]